jgi:hypothetical protein
MVGFRTSEFRSLLFIIVCLLFLINGSAHGQSPVNYNYLTNSTASLISDKDGNSIDMSVGTTLIYGSMIENYAAALQNIGFSFYFMGVPYTQFSTNPSGQVALGALITGSTQTIPDSKPVIVLNNQGAKTSATGKVHFKMQGISPNRVLIIEWMETLIPASGTANANTSTYQLRLYEYRGIIELVYGQMYNTEIFSIPNSIWFNKGYTLISGQVTSITSHLSYVSNLNNISASLFTANSPMMNLNSSVDGSRRLFRFSPIFPTVPSNVNFTNVSATALTVNWNDNASTELDYEVLRSTDGINYTHIAYTGINSTSFSETGLSPNHQYYYRIAASYEGGTDCYAGNSVTTNPCSLNGVKMIPGDYPTIKAAVDDLILNGVSGPVFLELQSNYIAVSEPFPIVLPEVECVSSINSITIRPAAGASIAIAAGYAKFEINGGHFWIIDGRAGGTGPSQLSISNSSGFSTNTAISIVNGSSYNIIKYVSLINTGTNEGAISFGSDSIGNSFNKIENCSIDGNAGTSVSPFDHVSRYGVYSAGNALFQNRANEITNCNIFDWFSQSDNSGIFLDAGNSEWSLSNNSFYQTTYRLTHNVSKFSAINISCVTGKNFTVSENHIGGNAPLCGGNTYALRGSMIFSGIMLKTDTIGVSSIQGNTISNLNFEIEGFDPFYGIECISGNANIGTVSGNVIGNDTGQSSIEVSTPIGTSRGISFNGNVSNSIISNNVIGSMRIFCTTDPNSSHNFIGIDNSSQTTTIENNLIGSLTDSGSIKLTTIWTSATQNATAINSFTKLNSSPSLISHNTIANINHTQTSVGQSVIEGINCGGTAKIKDNIIRNIYTPAFSSVSAEPTIIGINFIHNNSQASEISGNSIYHLSNTGMGDVTGIRTQLLISSPLAFDSISGNDIHSLAVSDIDHEVKGIHLTQSETIVINNFIRLGTNSSGVSLNNSAAQYGIYDEGSENRIQHNSVYLNGDYLPINSKSSYAFYGMYSTGIIQNNIFINNRSNFTTGGNHFAVLFGTINTNSVVSNNLYYAGGNGGALGSYGSDTAQTLATWQGIFNIDHSSKYVNLCFMNIAPGFPDLHLINCPGGNAAEGAGILIPYVRIDFDNEIRSTLTPVDIGADAGLYTPVPVFVQENILSGNEISLFPNPASDKINIAGLKKKGKTFVSVINLTGSKILERIIENADKPFSINIEGLKPGIYFLEISSNGIFIRKKFVRI